MITPGRNLVCELMAYARRPPGSAGKTVIAFLLTVLAIENSQLAF
jgi:hypothetical protein